MTVDLSVFGKIKTPDDYRRAEEIFQLQKQKLKAGTYGSTPAAIKINREIEEKLKIGDIEGANRLMQIQKVYDKGINPYGQQVTQEAMPLEQTQQGALSAKISQHSPSSSQSDVNASSYSPSPIPGYADAVSAIEGAKISAKQQAKKNIDYAMNPKISAAEVQAEINARMGSEPFLERRKAEEKARAQKALELGERIATFPQLMTTVDRLGQLGKDATYTYAGQGVDFARQQMGLEPTEGAVARKEYVSLVDNQILPLLRQTFGAQFTEREGESLKRTLGDPNASPQEKEAVLRSFIQQKMQTINSMERELGVPLTGWEGVVGANNPQYGAASENDVTEESQQIVMPEENTPVIGDIIDGYVFLGGDPANEKSWKKAR